MNNYILANKWRSLNFGLLILRVTSKSSLRASTARTLLRLLRMFARQKSQRVTSRELSVTTFPVLITFSSR